MCLTSPQLIGFADLSKGARISIRRGRPGGMQRVTPPLRGRREMCLVDGRGGVLERGQLPGPCLQHIDQRGAGTAVGMSENQRARRI